MYFEIQNLWLLSWTKDRTQEVSLSQKLQLFISYLLWEGNDIESKLTHGDKRFSFYDE